MINRIDYALSYKMDRLKPEELQRLIIENRNKINELVDFVNTHTHTVEQTEELKSMVEHHEAQTRDMEEVIQRYRMALEKIVASRCGWCSKYYIAKQALGEE